MNYLNKIENIIEDHIVEVKRYEYHANQNLVETYFNIGKLLVEAQGGETRAKYGNGLIKEYSIVLTKKYGKGYDISNLKRMRSLFLTFQKGGTLSLQLSWSHLYVILTIKNESKRNYYINQTIQNTLSVRELKEVIKNYSFERLSYADKNNIKIIDNNKDLRIEDKGLVDPRNNSSLKEGKYVNIRAYFNEDEALDIEYPAESTYYLKINPRVLVVDSHANIDFLNLEEILLCDNKNECNNIDKTKMAVYLGSLNITSSASAYKFEEKGNTVIKYSYEYDNSIIISYRTVIINEGQYTITYDCNGGTGPVTTSDHIYLQESYLALNAYSKAPTSTTVYGFKGWSTSPSSSTIEFTDGQKMTDYKSSNFTLYAVWGALFSYNGSYSIVPEANGNWKIYFRSSGTITFNADVNLDLFVVGGAGGGCDDHWSCYVQTKGTAAYSNIYRGIKPSTGISYVGIGSAGGCNVKAGSTTALGYTTLGGGTGTCSLKSHYHEGYGYWDTCLCPPQDAPDAGVADVYEFFDSKYVTRYASCCNSAANTGNTGLGGAGGTGIAILRNKQ